MALKLRDGWYQLVNETPFNMDMAGIYEWRIEGIGLYVGKANRLRSRIRAYPNNVRRMIEGLPWHGNPDRQYRMIHRELRAAYDAQTPVTVAILENCLSADRAYRERAWIDLRRQEETVGGPRLLNSI